MARGSDDDDEQSGSGSGSDGAPVMRLRTRPRVSMKLGYSSDVEAALQSSESSDEDNNARVRQRQDGPEAEVKGEDVEMSAVTSPTVRGRGRGRGRGATSGSTRARGRGASSTRGTGRGGKQAVTKKKIKGSDDDEESDFAVEFEDSESVAASEDVEEAESESAAAVSDDSEKPKKRGPKPKAPAGSSTQKKRQASDDEDEAEPAKPKGTPEATEAAPKKRGRKPKYQRAEGDETPAPEGDGTADTPSSVPKKTYKPPNPAEQTAESLADPKVQQLTTMIKNILEASKLVTPLGDQGTMSTPQNRKKQAVEAEPTPEPTPESTPEPVAAKKKGRPAKNPGKSEVPTPGPSNGESSEQNQTPGQKRKAGEEQAGTNKRPKPSEREGEGASTLVQVNPAEVNVFKIKMVDKRYKCYVPGCSKTFLNVEGIKYHCEFAPFFLEPACEANFLMVETAGHYVHEIVHLLLNLFPKTPEDKNKGTDATAAEPHALLPLIRDDVVELYNSFTAASLPIKIDDYPPLFPDTKIVRILPFVFGRAKERADAVKTPRGPKKAVKKPKEGDESSDPEGGRQARSAKIKAIQHDWEVSEEPVKQQAGAAKCEYDKLDTEVLVQRFVHGGLRPTVGDFTVVEEAQAEAYFPRRAEAQIMFRKSSKIQPVASTIKRFDSCVVGGCFWFDFSFSRFLIRLIQTDGKGRKGYVLNASGAVWGLNWAPGIPRTNAQYLAIGTRATTNEDHVVLAARKTGAGCIQLWKMPTESGGLPVLDMCILHEFGSVWDLSWCPYGGYEAELPNGTSGDALPRLGILAASFTDGSVRLFAVPHPDALREKLGAEGPIYGW